jgi:glycosyltransferase involved in cell wall biosynthesis
LNYLLINHVPFGRGKSADTFVVGDMWLEDLRAQARAINEAGMKLIVATPLVDKLQNNMSGSFNSIEIVPREHGFEYRPLPFYITFGQFLKTKGRMIAALLEAIRGCDIMQCGYGGHPVALGELAWPIAAKLHRQRIWVFDGADPFPRLERNAREENNPIKRMAKKVSVRRFQTFCRNAVRDADLVFAHNAAVVERFKDVWNGRCHQFDRSFVTDATLISDEELQERQQRLLDATKPLRLVVAGRQIAIKGTDHVLRAMRKAIDRGAKLELDVMGDGDDLAQFKALAGELNLNDVARFAGTVPYGKALFDAWANSHVMVITNLTAEISRNVLLAMARGMPLIMYANPGTDELLRSSGAGFLVSTGDIDALADAFTRAASDRRDLPHMAVRGLATARSNTLDATHRRRAALARGLLSNQM